MLEQREQDIKDMREALLEREDELAAANDKVAELQNDQAETHDRLEETLANIERDNAEKETDLIAANREIEAVSVTRFLLLAGADLKLGQRVYELEEACEELRAKEIQLDSELRSADEAFDQAKTHYESLVAALKEARKNLQEERDEAVTEAREAEAKRLADLETATRAREYEVEKLRRALAEREQVS